MMQIAILSVLAALVLAAAWYVDRKYPVRRP